IVNNDRVGAFQRGFELAEYSFLDGGRKRHPVLAVGAADLLVMRNYPCLYAGCTLAVSDQTGHRSSQGAKLLAKPLSFEIAPHHPDGNRHRAKTAHVGRNGGGAAEAGAFTPNFDDRNRRFRTDSGDSTPDETVQHHVADNQNSLSAKSPYRFDQSVPVAVIPGQYHSVRQQYRNENYWKMLRTPRNQRPGMMMEDPESFTWFGRGTCRAR